MTAVLRRLFAVLAAPFREPEPYFKGPVHCVNCGRGYTAVIPESSPHWYPGLGVVDMVQCPRCGYHTVCSD